MGKPEKILAAYSGGADSTALLWLLRELSLQENLSLLAVHVDHGIRQASGNDARHAENFCKAWGIDFQCAALHLGSHASEDEAREARYQALSQVGRERGFFTLALAHHRQDQCETMLLRLMRGTAGGLKGMKAVSCISEGTLSSFTLWRPLLDIDPQQLKKMLIENHLSWCEDETNANDRYLRNHVRLHLLPLFEKVSPSFTEHMSHTAHILQDEDDYFQKETEKWLHRFGKTQLPCPFLRYDLLLQEHPALQRRIVRTFFSVCGLKETLSYQDTNALIGMKDGEKRNLPLDWHAVRTGNLLHAVPAVPPSVTFGKIKASPFTGCFGDGKKCQAFPQDLLEHAVLRTRKEGDFIQPFGMKGKKSLQDYFVDRKISAPFRNYIPLLCCGKEVLWAIGTGASQKAASRENETRIFLQYQGKLPMEF